MDEIATMRIADRIPSRAIPLLRHTSDHAGSFATFILPSLRDTAAGECPDRR